MLNIGMIFLQNQPNRRSAYKHAATPCVRPQAIILSDLFVSFARFLYLCNPGYCIKTE